MTLDSIIERLEKADRPDRKLDIAIMNLLDPRADDEKHLVMGKLLQSKWGAYGQMANRVDYYIEAPKVTSSVDAAIELAEKVLPGWNFTLSSRQAYVRRPWADVASDAWIEDNNKSEYAEASGATLSIAMCIAILKAKQMGVGE